MSEEKQIEEKVRKKCLYYEMRLENYLGKTVFLTSEEAKKALAKMKIQGD